MAKAAAKEVPAEVATVEKPAQAVAVKAQASAELMERIAEVKDNLESIENFKVPRIKATPTGLALNEEDEVTELEGTLIHTKRVNVYYESIFDPSKVEPPTCSSLDGKVPEASSPKIQHATCDGCPKAQYGSSPRGKGKACRNIKPVFLLLGEGIMPRQLNVTPTSLKAANAYLMDLAERGIAYRKVRTLIKFEKKDKKDTYGVLKFAKGRALNASEVADVEFLKNQWLPLLDAQSVDQSELNEEEAHAGQSTKPEAPIATEY